MVKNNAAYTISFETLTPKLFESLYRSVGWESPCIEQIETALNNSYAKFVAYDGDKPVGMVRIIGDGGMSFYIKDYAVIPEYQSKGVGKALMQFLEDYIRNSMPEDWAVSLELISSKEAVAFYEKFGFVRSHKIPNFFTDNYDHLIYEGGVQLIDMVYLQRHI